MKLLLLTSLIGCIEVLAVAAFESWFKNAALTFRRGGFPIQPEPTGPWNNPAGIVEKPAPDVCYCKKISYDSSVFRCFGSECQEPCCICSSGGSEVCCGLRMENNCFRRRHTPAPPTARPPTPTGPPGRVSEYSTCICRKNGRDQKCEGLECRYPCCECHDSKWLCCGEEICEDKGKKPFYEDCGCGAGGGGGGGGGGSGGGTPTPRPTDGPIFTPPPW